MAGCVFKREGIQLCASRFNLKLVEFRHPDYKEFNEEILLCETHFSIVFEEMIEEERKAFNDFERRSKHYQQMFNEAKDAYMLNLGWFNRKDFHDHFYGKVDSAKSHLRLIQKGQCRLEYCNASLKGIKKPYTVRVYPINNMDYKNYFFCSKNHWEKIKMRIGLMNPPDPNSYNTITLADFEGMENVKARLHQ